MCKYYLLQHKHTQKYCHHKKNTKAHYQNFQAYMFTYPIEQHINKHKGMMLKSPVLIVHIPSTTTKNMSTNACFKIFHSYILHTL